MKIFLIIFSAVIALVNSVNMTIAQDISQIYQRSKNSIVIIMTTDGTGELSGLGSGFFVGDGSRIVTNLHVIKGGKRIFVKTPKGEPFEIKQVANYSEATDLAILVALTQGSALNLRTNTPEIGSSIIAIGNPRGLESTVSNGIISGVRVDDGVEYIQITAPISSGSSGGPVMDVNGSVIGVSTFYIAGSQNLNFIVPAVNVANLLANEKLIEITDLDVSSKTKISNLASKSPIKFIDVFEGYGRKQDGLYRSTYAKVNGSYKGGRYKNGTANNFRISGYVQNQGDRNIKSIIVTLSGYSAKPYDWTNLRETRKCQLVVAKYNSTALTALIKIENPNYKSLKPSLKAHETKVFNCIIIHNGPSNRIVPLFFKWEVTQFEYAD